MEPDIRKSAVAASAADGVVVFRCSADGIILEGNSAFDACYGALDPAATPRNAADLRQPGRGDAPLPADLRQGRIWEGLVHGRAHDGRTFDTWAVIIPQMAEGRFDGALFIETPAAGQAPAAGGAGKTLLAFGIPAVMMVVLAAAAWSSGAGGFALPLLLVLGLASCLIPALWLGRPQQAALRRMEDELSRVALSGEGLPSKIETLPGEWRGLERAARHAVARLRHGAELDVAAAFRREKQILDGMKDLNEVLEGEVHHMVNDITLYATRLADGSKALAETAMELSAMAVQVNSAVDTTIENMVTVANASEELEAASSEIAHRVAEASTLADDAREKADLSSRRVAGLNESSHRIGGMVATISGIAGQTRMLALNATIEANRAGEAGRGFAVVAEEVKSLARQTHDGIDSINQQAHVVESTTQDVVTTVDSVTGAIREIAGISAEIASAAGQQQQANRDIILSVNQAADQTHLVRDIVKSISGKIENAGTSSRRFREFAAVVHADIDALRRRLQVILRSAKGADRRTLPRISVGVPFTAAFGGVTVRGYTGDISVQGALLVIVGSDKPVSERGWVELQGIGRLDARIVAVDPSGWHAHFTNVSPEAAASIAKTIGDGVEKDRAALDRAIKAAAKAEQALEEAVRSGRIGLDDLFDTERTIIPDTDPPQFMAKHTTVVEDLFPQICEPEMAQPNTPICLISDRSCYVAVHNQKWSLPQKLNDRAWNMVWSRNRRVYDDRSAVLAARAAGPMVQTYVRNVGDGTYLVMKELDAPIMVRGRRWGTMRMGLKME